MIKIYLDENSIDGLFGKLNAIRIKKLLNECKAWEVKHGRKFHPHVSHNDEDGSLNFGKYSEMAVPRRQV